MNTPASRAVGLSSSGATEAEKVRGALTLLFNLNKLNTAAKSDEERRIKESRQCIQEMNEILEKKLG